MATTETVVARFEAQIIDFTKKMKEMADSSDRAAERVRRAHDKAADDVSKSWRKSGFDDAMKRNIGSANGLRNALIGIAPALAAAFSVKEAVAAADTYKRFTNSLKVAGLEGTNLATVQEALFQAAQKNGVALEPLSQLYGRASQSAKELGANQDQLLKFTNGVTAALRVQGGTTEQASGALTQLSQALSGGVIHAEEFNSINEGARPILEAVAAGNEKYGGSVAKLRAEMLKGKLSSAEFFNDFLAGSAMLESKAAKAPLTVAASWQILENALAKAIGQTDQTLGVTDRLSNGIKFLAENLDHVGEAIGVVGGLLGGALVVQGGKAALTFYADAVAATALTGAAGAAAAASRLLGTALAFVGGPWGIAIMAVATALGFLAVKGLEAKAATTALYDRIEANNKKLEESKRAVDDAKEKTGDLTKAQLEAATKTAKLTDEVNLLADAHWRAAAAAKAHALEEINARVQSAQTDLNDANREKAKEKVKTARQVRGPIGEPGSAGGFGGAASVGLNPNFVIDAAVEESKAAGAVRDAQRVLDAAKAEYAAEQAKSLKDPTYQPGKPSATATTKIKGRSAADIQRSDDKALAQAVQEELQFRLSNAKTEGERHALAVELLDLEHQNRLTAIDEDKNTSEAAKAKLKTIENTAYENRVRAEGIATLENQQAEEKEARDQRIEAYRRDLDAQARLSELNEDLLTWQARNARTAAERARFEAAALAAKQKRELDQIDAEIGLAKATNDAATALRLQAQRAVVVQRQGEETKDQEEHSKREAGDWGQWAKDRTTGVFDPAEINKALQDIADNGLAGLTDGITDAIMGAKSLGDAFKDVAKSIIADLIRIAVKMLIFKALGTLFPGFGNIATAAVSVGRNAAGTDSWKGGPTTLNENGPEAYLLPQGSQVAPAGLLRSALSTMAHGGGGKSGPTTNHFHTTVNASDAVLTGWVRQEIWQANMQSLQASRQLSAKDNARSDRNRL